MEFIQVNSYTPQEKYYIAKKYLIPQEFQNHGLTSSEISLSKKAIEIIISNYTREAGVRNLRRRIADICRKSARKFLEDDSTMKISINIKNLKDFLEKEVFEIEVIDKTPKIGVATGLAWTSVGGDVLKIEAIKIKGKGNLKLTGKLGDVMKESAQISFSVVKTLFDSGYLENDDEKAIYDKYDLHIHIPDGATPKDGPSAGIAMTTVIASILSGKKIRGDTAMTGEISLHGDVMPIGGLKEKIIAGHRAGVQNIIIPKKNYDKDLNDIPDEVKNTIEIKSVKKIEEVLNFLLV
jgi:ATP-dependent Lon protease